MIKTHVWVILIAAAAVVSATLLLRSGTPSDSVTAVISQDGAVLREIDLSRVKEVYIFTVTSGDGGFNTIEVSPGSIRVSEADCPDRICVSQGALPESVLPIVCLPHGLMIELRSGAN